MFTLCDVVPYVTLAFCNSYVLWLLRCVLLRLVTVTLSDVYVTWCYVLSQHQYNIWNLICQILLYSYSHYMDVYRVFVFSIRRMPFLNKGINSLIMSLWISLRSFRLRSKYFNSILCRFSVYMVYTKLIFFQFLIYRPMPDWSDKSIILDQSIASEKVVACEFGGGHKFITSVNLPLIVNS
jgi:hypothetical protein